MRVRCKTSETWSCNQVPPAIAYIINKHKPVVGQEYTVVKCTEDGYYQLAEISVTINMVSLAWHKDSFEIIDGISDNRAPICNHKPSDIPNCPPVIVGIPGV